MLVVVADTSPLNYLIQIEQESLLQRLYGRVLIPQAVLEELQRTAAPASVRGWAAQLPSWVNSSSVPPTRDAGLLSLDPGEREAIQLAESTQATLLLIDERRGTRVARSRGIETVGTLGILRAAHKRQWIDAAVAFHQLIERTSFRRTLALEDAFLTSLESERRI